MSNRIMMGKVQPEAYKAMYALDKYIAASSVERRLQEIIRIRASQINGCAYCVNHHVKDARKLGEPEQKMHLISVWKEAGDFFTDEEKILLSMTEEITLIHKGGLRDATYDKAIALLGEEKTAQAIMVIITINAWNRIGVGLNMHPEGNW
ncbi:MAG: carboxymuconolactone decarboxylase family protein [Bacteroidota bacterium]